MEICTCSDITLMLIVEGQANTTPYNVLSNYFHKKKIFPISLGISGSGAGFSVSKETAVDRSDVSCTISG